MTLEQLTVLLLALLPKDGTPRTAKGLAVTAWVWQKDVHDALKEPLAAAQVGYDAASDSYSLIRESKS